jgi:PAS domain S-box-containing protein
VSNPHWPYSYRSNGDFTFVVCAFGEIKRLNDRLQDEDVILGDQVDDLGDPTVEITRLRRSMNDLDSVLALPFAWRGREPVEILSTLVDSLMGMLSLDFLYVRVRVESDEKPLEALRTGPSYRADEIARSLDDWLSEAEDDQGLETRRKIGDPQISIFILRMSLASDLGFIVAGSRRPGFPEQTERLILSVAANQAAAALQQSVLLSERKRVAGELDLRVAERTRELAETNEELQLQVGLLQHLPVSAWTLEPDGVPDFVNQVWLEYSGQTLDFVQSRPEAWMTAVHPEDRETALRSFWDGVRSGQGFTMKTRSLRAQDGAYRWHLNQAVVLRDAEGKVLKFVGTSTDIDDQIRAEDELRARETHLRQTVDTIPGLVCTMRPTGEIEQLNRPLLEYFGKPPEELKGWMMTDAVHPDDLPAVIEAYTYAVTTGTPYAMEHRCRRADGVYRWFQVRASAVRDAGNKICGWYVLLTDIEDRKLAEEALKASESNLREILDNIPGLVGTWSPSGEGETLSRQFAEYFGRTVEELKDWVANDLVHPDDLQRVVAAFSTSLATGTPLDDEHRYLRADGVYRWFRVRAVPARDEEGHITRWYALSTDVDDLRRAEEALRASERKLRLIINTIPTTAWSTRPDGYCDFLSDRWLNYAGFTLEQAVGWNWAAAIHPDDAEGLREYWQSCLASGTPVDTEARMRRFDGVYRWFLFRANPFRDESGNIVKWYGTNVDIEDRKQAENALRANERNLIQIINTIPMLAWSTLPDGYVEFLNQRWLDFTGLSAEQAGGFGWSAAVHPDDVHGLVEYWQTALACGTGVDVEARLRRFDGQYRWFLFRADPLRDEAGAIVKWYGTNTDIDGRKRAEEALRMRELSLLQIIETIPEMLWSASPEGAIDYCNGRLLDYTGFSAKQVMADGWMSLLHPDDIEPTVAVWRSCVTTGAPYQVEVRTFHAADHTYRWCVTSALPLLDQEGRIVKWHGTVVDMHDWKQAQEELRNTQAELARITRVMTIGQLTASIAHEVSQPLSGILTNASTCLRMLKSDPPNIEGARETARRTIRDANRTSEVITRLRTLFSKKQIEVELLDLNEAAREVIALLSGELQRNNVILKHEFSDHLPAVKGDRVQLQQVILNLIRNGSDAMDTVHDRPRQLIIRTEIGGNNVTVSIQDSGVGFSLEISERLFESFFTTKQEGMGVGLSVSRSIVEAHQGRLWAVRNAGPGATFSFSIPQGVGNLPAETE